MSENPGVFESNFTRLRPFYSFYILPRIFYRFDNRRNSRLAFVLCYLTVYTHNSEWVFRSLTSLVRYLDSFSRDSLKNVSCISVIRSSVVTRAFSQQSATCPVRTPFNCQSLFSNRGRFPYCCECFYPLKTALCFFASSLELFSRNQKLILEIMLLCIGSSINIVYSYCYEERCILNKVCRIDLLKAVSLYH